jgi:hypothetical protein
MTRWLPNYCGSAPLLRNPTFPLLRAGKNADFDSAFLSTPGRGHTGEGLASARVCQLRLGRFVRRRLRFRGRTAARRFSQFFLQT